MNEATAVIGAGSNRATRALSAAARLWFVVAVIGQWMFVYYVAVHYGGSALAGDLAAWGKSSIKGYVTGDSAGNAVFAAHALMAATLTFAGALQLIPLLRSRAIGFHRWNGRVFIVSAIAISFGGLYLVWIRDASTTLIGSLAISLNAVLIVTFALFALGHARARRFAVHRRWALRTFLVVNAVWFFRVGIMGWIVINQGPVGIGENLEGPVAIVLNFANYLLPLAVLEGYFYAQNRSMDGTKLAMACVLVALTALMGVGIFGAFMFMWRPFL